MSAPLDVSDDRSSVVYPLPSGSHDAGPNACETKSRVAKIRSTESVAALGCWPGTAGDRAVRRSATSDAHAERFIGSRGRGLLSAGMAELLNIAHRMGMGRPGAA